MKRVMEFIDRKERWLAIGLLALMLALGIGSMLKDSAIVDEVAHIPSGYSYVKYGDYRLNPEHPPLIKDLSAVPLLFVPHLQFPNDIKAWTTDPNGQWETGWHFIYHYGNNADQILLLSRLPILLLAIVLGWVIYSFTRKHFGKRVALLATFLYALEPNILAHARFVTTDLGIAAFNFFAFIGLWRWLKKPNWKNLAFAGVLFGLAQLAKFSAILLIPFMGLLVIIWIIANKEPKQFWPRFWKFGFGLAGIYLIGFLLVWLAYIPHTINMPEAVQDQLITASLPGNGPIHSAGQILIRVNHLPGMKAAAQYALGVLMVQNRVSSGNTTYFLGEVTNQSFVAYFPVTYLIKTPLALIILAMLSGLTGIFLYFKHKPLAVWTKFKDYARNHFVELSSLLYIAYYSYLSITGNLNLGIRHLLPIMPFVLIMVAVCTNKAYANLKGKFNKIFGYIMLAGLLGWYLVSNLITYPHYVAYFNELIGGGGNAYNYVTDSSVDWGQDLRRLKDYVDAHPEINRIAVDYFGGGDARYYFCKRLYVGGQLVKSAAGYDCSGSKFVDWHAEMGIPATDYFAVSETFLMNDLYYAPKRRDAGYDSIRKLTPVAKIGNSIYVYKLH